jgi:hypothetical protein
MLVVTTNWAGPDASSNPLPGRRVYSAGMITHGDIISLEEFFTGSAPKARSLFNTVRSTIDAIGPAEMRVTKSQIAFRRQRSFAWTWLPGRYLSGALAPLVLTVNLDRFDTSVRWKEVAEPTLNHFMHHLELHSTGDIDALVLDCLREAWAKAD